MFTHILFSNTNWSMAFLRIHLIRIRHVLLILLFLCVCFGAPTTTLAAPTQTDSLGLTRTDVCTDSDGDGVCDEQDNCVDTPNPGQEDVDGDGVGDACDNCVDTPNPDQADGDNDGLGDACEAPPEILTCNGDLIGFENGIPASWTVIDNTGGTGIIWVTTADPACEIPNRTNGSGEAACADSDAAGTPAIPYDTELWSNPIDLTGFATAQLDVAAYYWDIITGNDRLEIDIWDGSTWTNELSWDETHGTEDISLNLSSYLGLSNVQVRFRYFGDGFDWFAQVDDIRLTCGEAPETGNITIIKSAPEHTSELFYFSGDIGDLILADGVSVTSEELAGDYTVYEIMSSMPDGWALTDVSCIGGDSTPYSDAATGEGVTIHLDSGEHITCTFTNTQTTYSLGDRIWEDTNEDGIQDAGEPGIPGVELELYTAGGTTVLDTDTTDANGYYLFGNLPDGSYVVKTVSSNFAPGGALEGYSYSPQHQGGDDTVDSDFDSSSGEATGSISGADNLTVDGGFYQPAGTILAYKFYDLDGNGVWDQANEAPLSGWMMTLYEGSGCSGNELASGVTDGNGNVTFSNLQAGNYSIAETLKSGWQNTTPLCQNITLAAGGSEIVLFGNQELGTITAHKFNDLNGNGVQDLGEEDLSGWTMNLYAGSSCASPELASGVTDSSGNVTFSGLQAGSYSVMETLQTGWQNTTDLCQDITLPAGGSESVSYGNQHEIYVSMDIKPKSCPNPLSMKEKGVLPVAIMGLEDFDVTQIDPATVRLFRKGIADPIKVAPLRWSLEDSGVPYEPFLGKVSAYDCLDYYPDEYGVFDGYLDLSIKFKAQEVVAALGEINDGDMLVLQLSGNLKEEFGGTKFIGEDVVWILKK